MKQVTPEDCYNYFHQETNAVGGRRVRAVKNFDKAHERDDWSYFESFAQKCNRNGGMLNPKTFITILAKHYGGWFHPKSLISQKSIKLYKSYMRKQDMVTTDESIKANIMKSLKYVVTYCRDNDLNSFEDYFLDGCYVVPQMARDLNAGNISKYMYACMPDADSMLDSYPKDIKEEFFLEFIEEYPKLRMRIMSSKDKTVKNLSVNFSKIVKELINKVKK